MCLRACVRACVRLCVGERGGGGGGFRGEPRLEGRVGELSVNVLSRPSTPFISPLTPPHRLEVPDRVCYGFSSRLLSDLDLRVNLETLRKLYILKYNHVVGGEGEGEVAPPPPPPPSLSLSLSRERGKETVGQAPTTSG